MKFTSFEAPQLTLNVSAKMHLKIFKDLI